MISVTAAITGVFGALLYFVCGRTLLWLRHRNFKRQHQCFSARKFPQKERLLGIDLMFENVKCWKEGTLLNCLRQRFDEAGETYSATVAGSYMIFTIEPENIKAIFADQFYDFDAGWIRRRAFAPAIGDVLITADGPPWRHQRSMLRPAFNKQQFSDYMFFKCDIDDLIAQITNDGSTIDMSPLFHAHAITLASRLLFDEPMATFDPEYTESSNRFIDAFAQVNKGTELRVRLGRFLPLQPPDRSFEDGCKVVHEYADMFVQKALKYRKSWEANHADQEIGMKDRYVFLRELVQESADPLELRNHLLGMLLVGSETTANLLAGCFSMLSSRPQLWSELRREALTIETLNSEAVTLFKPLRYLINEVLRLYPILPLFGRMANKDTYLPTGGGSDGTSRMFVPKGTQVMINTYSLHRREDTFGSDAEEFKPKRWESLKALNHWSYLPFGGGPRICIGQQFALLEASYTIIRLLQTYPKIESRDSRPWREQIGISLSNGNGAKVAFPTL